MPAVTQAERLDIAVLVMAAQSIDLTRCSRSISRTPASPGPSPREEPELRASDAERERAVDILRIAAGDGRLTPAELDARLEVALTARTIGELATVTADLPGGSTPYTAGLVRVGGSQHDDLVAGRWAVLRSLLARQADAPA